ncbi:hypothetical protein Krac_11361 [Ktedonobacter racemifer DSM 44963]|uniref:Uncharacterized protein n=1 Tax=Ktedonobacter racemifer DSM 44963 TaxID=485913 RepID=D6TK36_KTERA|nr:hypothetical protein Krac_11361 [Ktedonobacter racemifer DSM 44963]
MLMIYIKKRWKDNEKWEVGIVMQTRLTPVTRVSLLESALQNGTVLPSTQTMSSWLEMSSDGTNGRKKRYACAG